MTTSVEAATGAEHRPWPVPARPPVMTQSWRTQLFAHWPVPQAVLRGLVPEPLIIDQFEGTSYVGITPFRLAELRFGPLPQMPVGSDFPEVNLRTYVRFGQKTGIYFFSLDAASQLAVLGARFTFHLPYFHADMSMSVRDGDWMNYRSRRLETPHADFVARYRPNGEVFNAAPHSLDHFLIERYALFTVPEPGMVMCAEINHEPWNVRPAVAEIIINTLAAAQGISLPNEAPLLHYSDRQDATIWAPEREN